MTSAHKKSGLSRSKPIWENPAIQGIKTVGTEAPEWISPSYTAEDWNSIRVPGTWTLQGFDKPHYTNADAR